MIRYLVKVDGRTVFASIDALRAARVADDRGGKLLAVPSAR